MKVAIGWRFRCLLVCGALVLVTIASQAASNDPQARFREANSLVRAGDLPAGIAAYRALATAGCESTSLYWNWAQAESARGGVGAALWALLRARELTPTDAAIGRELEHLRQAANLDAAELAPEPLSDLARNVHRFHVPVLALLLLIASLAFHGLARAWRLTRWPVLGAWSAAALGSAAIALTLLAETARPTGVVVRRGAALLDAASPVAAPLVTLREGEVVPILAESGGYLRVQDSSGARGWASRDDVFRLDRPPVSAAPGR